MMSDFQSQINMMSARIGANKMWVQAAGGNISWKDRGILWIKGSGKWLSAARIEPIFCSVDLNKLKEQIKRKDFSTVAESIDNKNLRPSIETILHAIMPHKIVAHVHSLQALSVLVRKNISKDLQIALNSIANAVTVEYRKPGEELATAVYNAMIDSPSANVILLKNHGIVIGAETIPEVYSLLKSVEDIFSKFSRVYQYSETFERYCFPVNNFYELHSSALVNSLACDPTLLSFVEKNWAICPDHVVFLGPFPIILNADDQISEILSLDHAPEILFLPKKGVMVKKGISLAKLQQLEAYAEVVIRNIDIGNVRCLSSGEVDELINWDAEKYRQSIQK